MTSEPCFIIVFKFKLEADNGTPVVAQELYRALKMLGCSAACIGVSEKGSHECRVSGKSLTAGEAQSSLHLAQKFGAKGAVNLLLLITDLHEYPPGFMSWMESFPELTRNITCGIKLAELIRNAGSPEARLLFVCDAPPENFDFVATLYGGVMAELSH